ncbi:MAG: hypothetical protein E6G50_11185 [Actinobacteria bacterium]|nr:MAG: hypothetical protein E6G50_11185 [Actinomycetota bacterium]
MLSFDTSPSTSPTYSGRNVDLHDDLQPRDRRNAAEEAEVVAEREVLPRRDAREIVRRGADEPVVGTDEVDQCVDVERVLVRRRVAKDHTPADAAAAVLLLPDRVAVLDDDDPRGDHGADDENRARRAARATARDVDARAARLDASGDTELPLRLSVRHADRAEFRLVLPVGVAHGKLANNP